MTIEEKFKEYIDKFNKLDTRQKQQEIYKNVKLLAVTTQELCEKIGVKNEVFISEKMNNFDYKFNEDDYYEILITLLSSIQKSQADFNYGIINFMSKDIDDDTLML